MKKIFLLPLVCFLTSCFEEAHVKVISSGRTVVVDQANFDSFRVGDTVLLEKTSIYRDWEIETRGHGRMEDHYVAGDASYVDAKGDSVENKYYYEYCVGVIQRIN